MKKIMTLAVSAILALGLAACEDAEVEETPSGGDESSETVPDTGTTGPTTEDTHPGYVICGDLEGIDSWTNEPDKTSDFYLSTASGETHWERTITGLAEDNGYCGFRVLTYGEWDSVCGASELTADSTGVSTNSNDIIITDGVTYDLVIDISDTAKSIKVTEVVDLEPTSGYAITYAEEQTAVSAADSKMYYWVDEGENHVDPVDGENYYDEGVYHIAYTVEEGLSPVWYGVQLFMELSAEDKAAASLTTGDEYYVSFTISSTVNGSITVNGNVVEISAGETEVNVKSTTTIEQDASYWADYGYTDETTGEEAGEWIETTAATLRVQLGVDPSTFLGEATLAISDLAFTKVVPEEGSVSVAYGSEADIAPNAEGVMYYWNDSSVTVGTHSYYEASDRYEFSYTSSSNSVWYGFQLFLQPTAAQLSEAELTAGETATIKLTITSSVSGSVTICGHVIELEADVAQDVEVTKQVPTANTSALFDFQAGVDGTGLLQNAALTITGLTFEKYVEPSEYAYQQSVDWEETKFHSQLGEYYASSTTQTVETGGAGTLERWAGDSTNGFNATITVTNEVTTDKDSVTYLTSAGYSASVSSSSTEAYWYGFQLFYTLPGEQAIPSGKSFAVQMDINVSVAMNVTINDVSTSLVAGDNTVKVVSGHDKGAMHNSESSDWDHTYERTDLEFQAGVEGEGMGAQSFDIKITSLTFLWN